MSELLPGTRVRIKTDPGRVGILTQKQRERRGTLYLCVTFLDGTDQFIPEDHLEAVVSPDVDPLDLFERGRFARPRDLRRTLTHSRLSGRLANVIYSMDVTGSDFYAYQFKPLVKLLNSATTGMLIADEVGLGKTIEAGLIWTELRSRFDYQRLLVLCPAILRNKWKLELRRRFGVEAEICSADNLLETLRLSATEPHAQQFAIICSMQGVRPPKGWDEPDAARPTNPTGKLAHFLSERQQESPLVDLLIIDEAHYLRNPDTATATAGRLLRAVSEFVILLSATPVHLKSDDLFQLVHLADPDTFDRRQGFSELLEANAPLVAARDLVISGGSSREALLELLETASRNPLLHGSQQLDQIVSQFSGDIALRDPRVASELAYRLETVNLLGHVVTRTRKRDVTEWRVVREVFAVAINLTDVERQFYEGVTNAIKEYASHSSVSDGFLLVMPQRQMSSSMAAAYAAWRSRQVDIEDVFYQDIGDPADVEEPSEWHLGPLTSFIVSRIASIVDYQDLVQNDSKYIELIRLLKQFVRDYPGEKIVVFSYFRPTLHYLFKRLTDDGIDCELLHGGTDDKMGVLQEFQNPNGPMLLLSSEVGSEGIDLQFCWAMFNYDLPWNPMRVEQRIGRVDRLGQQSSKVQIRNFFYDGTIDSRIYRRLYERLDIFEHSLGALEPVLGELIQSLAVDLITKDLTPQQQDARIDQTHRALENTRLHEEQLEEEAVHLVAYGDYIVNQVNAARELGRHVDGLDLRDYVVDFYTSRYPGSEFMSLDDGNYWDVSLSSDARFALDEFIHQRKLRSTTNLTRMSSRAVRCKFHNSVIEHRALGTETINQFHPLVRFVTHALRSDEFQNHPAIAAQIPVGTIPNWTEVGQFVFAVQQWYMKGLQELELLYYTSTRLNDPESPLTASEAEVFVNTVATLGSDWYSAIDDIDLALASDVLWDKCVERAEAARRAKAQEYEAINSDRARLQEATLKRQYESQRRNLEQVLLRHLAFGRDGLAKATEGKIQALTDRMERRQREIIERKQFSHHGRVICVGVILVTP